MSNFTNYRGVCLILLFTINILISTALLDDEEYSDDYTLFVKDIPRNERIQGHPLQKGQTLSAFFIVYLKNFYFIGTFDVILFFTNVNKIIV